MCDKVKTVYNFSAGPSALPKDVLAKAQSELLSYNGSGMSVMELSHRSNLFAQIIADAEARLRELLSIPNQYRVLFLQGGASQQFAMVPMNLMIKHQKADYVITGSWSQKAFKEAEKFGQVRIVGQTSNNQIPELSQDMFDPEADYVHITTNNTIEGTAFHDLPDTGSIPLVADASSNLLSTPLDVTKFGLIYAGAQKNIGPAGLTVVIIREDLLGHTSETVPTMLDYKTHADKASLYNTPPTFAIYMAKLVFEWLLDLGGLSEIEKINRQKAELLYQTLDHSKLFEAPIDPKYRSIMNIPFKTIDNNQELEAAFIKEAQLQGLETLKGHRSVGGMRASIYNAMPYEGVEALVEFIQQFERKHS